MQILSEDQGRDRDFWLQSFRLSGERGTMVITLLKALYKNIASFFHLSSCDNIKLEPVKKYYQRAEEILKLLKPILDAIVDSEIAFDEMLNTAYEELGQSVDELRELFYNWQPLSSKVYFVLQIEPLISRIRNSGLDVFQHLRSSHKHLPDELCSDSLELCIQKIKHMGDDQTSSIIIKAIRDQVEGVAPSADILVKVAESLSLRSNQEVLIEAVALEKLKENAEQAYKTEEGEYVDQMIDLVTHMHDNLVMAKQSQSCSPVPIPADFCCPLSLELMTDPVIVASGQTYERAFIRKWIDLGLTFCPKTRQTLAHTNLICNYTVKALIANWCESNNVKLPDPIKSSSSNQSSPVFAHPECGEPRRNQSILAEHTRSTSSPAKIPSRGMHGDGTSALHVRSTSEQPFSGNLVIGQGPDNGRISCTNSGDRSANMEEQTEDSVDQSRFRKELSNASNTDDQSSWSHSRTASASSMTSIATPQETPGNTNQDQELHPTYSSDASADFGSEPQASATLTARHRETEFPHRMETRTRNQSIWRRPSDRFVSRIVPSATTETRPDLSGLETQVQKLVEDLASSSVETQRDATAELRLLAKHNMDNRIVIANCGAISFLVNLLHSTEAKIQENAVTALLNLSINDNNKNAIANADAIEPLIYVLETGSSVAKENSAATLFSLSVIEDNKIKIGRSGAIRPLVDLLGNGTPRGKKDASTALFNLSIFHENKARIVQAGAVKYLVELMDPAAGMVDKAVAVLANLATIPEGRTAIGQEGGIPMLVEVVELGSARGKENAAAALLQLCTSSSRFCNVVLQEGAVPPLVALSQSGTPRAKEKAQALLSYFRNQRHGNAGRG